MPIFKQRVIAVLSKIPRGKVVSYGQIAAYLDSPRAARQVGWVLRGLDGETKLPWWRVVNNQGRISIKGNFIATPQMQKALLEKEGILIDKDFKLDIERYRFRL